MDFDFTDEQQLLRETVVSFLKRTYSFEQRKGILDSEAGWSRDIWAKLAELGLLALPLPEDCDGLDGTGIDIYAVAEAFGHGLVVEPWLPTVLAAKLIAAAGSDAQRRALLPAVGEGESVLALALGEFEGRYELSRVSTRARREGEGYVLEGAKSVVLGGAQADVLIVSARTSGEDGEREGLSLFVVRGDAEGLERRDYPLYDGRRAAELHLSGVRVEASARLGDEGTAWPHIERSEQLAIAALCAEGVGVMDALNKATIEYLKTRRQFGVPIGKFQVLQHRAVDMLMATEETRSLALLAAARVGDGIHGGEEDTPQAAAERARACAAAKHTLGRAGRAVGQGAVQLHGGIGITDELVVAHWFKRLTVLNQLFGDADHHLARFSDALRSSAGKAAS